MKIQASELQSVPDYRPGLARGDEIFLTPSGLYCKASSKNKFVYK